MNLNKYDLPEKRVNKFFKKIYSELKAKIDGEIITNIVYETKLFNINNKMTNIIIDCNLSLKDNIDRFNNER